MSVSSPEQATSQASLAVREDRVSSYLQDNTVTYQLVSQFRLFRDFFVPV